MEASESSSSSKPTDQSPEKEKSPVEQVRSTRLKWSGFGKKKQKSLIQEPEYICPYKNCGRKFVSDMQLATHIDRRHKAPEETK
jgi:hypothetical protein